MNFQSQPSHYENFNWMKSFESLSFVIDYRQYYLYYLWNSNLNFVYDSVFLSHFLFPQHTWDLYLAYIFFLPIFLYRGLILPIFSSRIYIYNIYHCQGQE